MKDHILKPVVIWLFTGCFLIFAMVVIGGITRLTHSGLSMVEWNMIVGSMPPTTEAEWLIPFEKYKLSPEYKLINNQFTLEEFKSIYWWEYVHRLLGRTIGVVFIVPFFYFLIKKKFDSSLLKKMIVLLLLGAFQGVLGWFMVKSGLQKEPHVSHYRLAAHLISAFTVFGFTFWYALDILFPQRKPTDIHLKRLIRLSNITFAIITLQIIYGAFVAGLKAGLFYNTFPMMGTSFFPDTITSHSPLFINFLENPAGVQAVHRYIAYIVVVMVLYLFSQSLKITTENSIQRTAIYIVVGIVSMQFFLGVATIMLAVPVSLGVLHQVGAFALFASMLYFKHTLIKKN
jgi:cytochrome c oxidase assembly protein subunit 15